MPFDEVLRWCGVFEGKSGIVKVENQCFVFETNGKQWGSQLVIFSFLFSCHITFSRSTLPRKGVSRMGGDDYKGVQDGCDDYSVRDFVPIMLQTFLLKCMWQNKPSERIQCSWLNEVFLVCNHHEQLRTMLRKDILPPI